MTDNSEFKIPLKDGDLEILEKVPEIGGTYPLYGMITEILSENPLTIMINNQTKGKCNITDLDKIKIIKDRAFEPGIFITTLEQKLPDGTFVGTVATVIFGKRKELDA